MYFLVLEGENTIEDEKPYTAVGINFPDPVIYDIVWVFLLIISIIGSVEWNEKDLPKIL